MAEKTTTNEELLGGLVATQALQSGTASGLIKLKLGRLASALRPEAKLIQDEIAQIEDKYAPRDEQGKRPPVSPKTRDTAQAEIDTLLKGAVTVNVPELTEQEIDAVQDVTGSIEGILPFLKA